MHFETTAFCTGRATANIRNPLVRVHNALVTGMQRTATLPKMIVVVLEDDIIRHLNHNDYGATEMFGKVISYLELQLQNSILDLKALMPRKAKRVGCPHIVWIAPSIHQRYENNNLRKKFGNELETQLRGKPYTSVLRLRQVWDPNNNAFVTTGDLSSLGQHKLWDSIDRSIAFADRLIFGAVRERVHNCYECNRASRPTCRAFIKPRKRLPPPIQKHH